MNTKRVSATLSIADQDAVMTAIDTIRQKLPFLIDLTANERVAMAKLGDKSQGFVKKALEIAIQNPGMLPVSFDLEEMRKDAQLFESLSAIQFALDKLHNEVDDTAIQAGGEAYAAARAVYAATKNPFATPALRSATNELRKRFGRKSSPATPAESNGQTPSPESNGQTSPASTETASRRTRRQRHAKSNGQTSPASTETPQA